MRVMQCCEEYGVPYTLENPRGSMVWELPVLQRFQQRYSSKVVHFDFCQYGERWQKPTTLFYNHIGFHSLEKCCNSNKGICSRTHCPHIRLAGADDQGVFLTLRAQPYPTLLAATVGDLVARALHYFRGVLGIRESES